MRITRKHVSMTWTVTILMLILIATPPINSEYSSLQQGETVSTYGTMRAMFEIELLGTDDIAYLYNEPDIGVLATVQQTPRYGVSGEAWVDGVWTNSRFFDTTLSDRFIVKCIEEKAISISSYAWIEWTAPILEGTTYDGEFGIFFEYGAESGVIQPPFDRVGGTNGKPPTDSHVITVTSPVRTGSHAVEMYQPPPTKSDADRRIVFSKWQNNFENRYNEFYLSWWVLFPSGTGWDSGDPYPASWGTNLGGAQLWFGTSANRYRWRTRIIMQVRPSSREIACTYSWWKFPDRNDDGLYNDDDSWSEWTYSGLIVSDHLDEWFHFQIYWKITTGSDSVVRVWANLAGQPSTLLYKKTTWTADGITCADPRGYSDFYDQKCVWCPSNVDGYAHCGLMLYANQTSAEKKTIIDDIVWATEKVSETYGVGY